MEDFERTFLGFPPCADVSTLRANAAILGIPSSQPYGEEEPECDQHLAPQAIRSASQILSLGLDRYDFDLGGAVFTDAGFRVRDCGDVPFEGNHSGRNIENLVGMILRAGAIPIILGGDHSVTIPVLRGFAGQGTVTVVQVDAHLDWREEVNGVRDGYSSPMRRASEMAHVEAIFQLGLRAQGSARQKDVQDALAFGANLVTAYQIHEMGMEKILEQIPDHRQYYLTIDADGLDPSVMPAVAGPAAGGLTFHQVRQLIWGLARKGKLAGMDIVEITPARDVNQITAITAGQLVLNFLGAVYQQLK